MPRSTNRRGRCRRTAARTATALALATALVAAACSDDSAPGSTAATELRVTALSSRPDMVTGGDVLIAITGTEDTPTVSVAGARQPTPTRDGDQWRVLVGVPGGTSTIEVTAGSESARLAVTDHPRNGPVFSGPQLDMPRCTTTDFGLAESTPPECDAPASVTYRYVDADGGFKDLADPTERPADLATATTPDGETIPFIVRIETGVINRGIYQLTALDPSPGSGTWGPGAWNRRLVYRFGGGCGTAYSQGFNLFGDPEPDLLERGYAIATSTFTTFQVNCNDVLSAETAMMVKEHFVESWGVPDLTIGDGGSGGAIQQLLIAQNYPGILDALAPTLPFPDAISISGGVVDCALLNGFYASPEGAGWTTEQKVAVNGHLVPTTCTFWEQTFVPGIDPTKCGLGDGAGAVQAAIPGLSKGLATAPKERIYDPVTNPSGLRCTLQDTNVNIYGRDPDTGFARRPWDNVGVQYGLRALDDGVITVDQFLDLNEGVGSFDIDGRRQPGRAEADVEAVESAYETGRVDVGGGDLARIPIILVNVYTDPDGDIHDRFRVFSIRDRWRGTDGEDPANLAIWTRTLPSGASLLDAMSGSVSVGVQLIGAVDEWATAVRADTSDASQVEKLARHRPASANDACFSEDGTVIESGAGLYDRPGPCVDPFPVKGDPRTAAGQDRRNDIVKCALAPVSEATYDVAFTDAQRSRLAAVFPQGVCDWTRPGIGQVPLGEPWHSFG